MRWHRICSDFSDFFKYFSYLECFLFRAYFYKKEIEPLLSSMSQIVEGLNISNLVENIKVDPFGFKNFFVIESGNIGFDELQSLFNAKFSAKGSNNYQIEVDVYQFFLDMIEEMCFSSRYC